MRRIIGNEVCVFLKNSGTKDLDIYGILVDVTEDSLYVQGDERVARMYVVPRDNVNYCTTNCLPSSKRTVQANYPEAPIPQAAVPQAQEDLTLSVFVDGDLMAKFVVPPTFKLDQWHDGIMRAVMGNPDVQNVLRGKIQKSIEYYPGEVYIITDGQNSQEELQDQSDTPQVAFTMGGGNPVSQFVNPAQMVARLQNMSAIRGKNNDKAKM